MSSVSNYNDLLPMVTNFNASIDSVSRISNNINIPHFWYFKRSDIEQLSTNIPVISANQGYVNFAGVRLHTAIGMNQDIPNTTHVTFVMSPLFKSGISGNAAKGDVTHILFEFARTCPPFCRKKSNSFLSQESEPIGQYYVGSAVLPRAFSIDYSILQELILDNPNNTHLVIERQLTQDIVGFNHLGLKIYAGIIPDSEGSDIEIIGLGTELSISTANTMSLGITGVEDFPL